MLVHRLAMLFPALLLAGCSLTGPARVSETQRQYVPSPVLTAPPSAQTGDSLFRQASSPSFFRDFKAFRVGDIVTIRIVESSTASKAADTDLSKDSSVSAGITSLLGYEYSVPHNPKRTLNPEAMIGATTANTFKGSGQTTRKESMTAQMSARVVQILTNGDMAIRGTREITVNHEKQVMILEGVIRSADIASDNTVLSSYIADARISYTGKGVVSDKQRPGWMSRALDYVWPF
jgi:flagellar L-ring protein precursor FlgH